MSSHGGKRVASEGKKMGAPSAREKNAAEVPPAGQRSVATFFGAGTSSNIDSATRGTAAVRFVSAQTAALGALVATGLRLDRHYTFMYCSPSRASRQRGSYC